ncbi:MAG: hypothetical protein ACI4UU_04190 [Clostridia bacterium]
MAANFKCTVKNSYSFDLDVPSNLLVDFPGSAKHLMGYIVFKDDGSVTFNPLHFGNAVSVKQSISTLSYVLELLRRHLKAKEFE